MLKCSLDQLAVLGGTPLYAKPLHVGRPNLGDRQRFLTRVGEVLDRAFLSNHGPCEVEFERQLARTLDVKHCLAVCNATVALEIALRALGATGEVIVPAFTAAATAHAATWVGLTPVLCDIDARTHNIDPQRVEELITPRTSAIVAVHLWGRPCAIEALSAIARRHQLRLIFDAAHAFMCTHRGRPVGSFGDAEVFSFHATKFCNSLEGGAITTNDDALAHRVNLMRTFGFAAADQVVCEGTNGKLNEIAAAMGLTSLESAGDFIVANRQNWQRARQCLAGLPGVGVIDYDPLERHNYHYLVLEVDAAAAGLSRDTLVEVLTAENVLARRHFHPGLHQWEPYRTWYPHAAARLPNTERVAQRVLLLPNGTAVSEQDVEAVCAIIRLAVEHAAELGRRLEPAPAASADAELH